MWPLTIPTVYDWTILPRTIVAGAWTDATFKAALLANPNLVLSKNINRWPSGINFTILENQGSTRHLILPHKKSQFNSWTRQQLMDTAMYESEADMSLCYVIPAVVLIESWFNSTFKSALLSNANSALSSFGINTGGFSYQVTENTSTNYHLILPKSPIGTVQISFDSLVFSTDDGNPIPAGTTRCCATGTCDLNTEPPVMPVP